MRLQAKMRHTLLGALAVIAVILGLGPLTSTVWADGDPGSDVLVYQDLFAASDAGLSVSRQVQFGDLLQAADRAGFPIRVAIIAGPDDLGAVTALWRKPRAYARFLGIELSLAYTQRLLVVMPNGFGFNWPGHSPASAYGVLAKIPNRAGGSGLIGSAEAAVRALAAASAVELGSPGRGTGAAPGAARSSGNAASSRIRAPSSRAAASGAASSSATASGAAGPAPRGRGTDGLVAIITVLLAALVAILLAARLVFRRRHGARQSPGGSSPGPPSQAPAGRSLVPLRWAGLGFAGLLAVAVGATILGLGSGASGQSQQQALAANSNVDPGTPVSGRAPAFALDDQLGKRVSLRSYRGKVVILAFTDSECTTICPMTTTAMLDAKAMLGAAGSQVQLLGIDANPAATTIEDVWSYSQLHGMTDQWHFLTGSLSELKRVWKSYAVEADIERGLIAHTPALFVIGPQGDEARVYVTQQSYAAIGQLGQVLAQEVSSLLPSHPQVHSDLSYAQVPAISPTSEHALPRVGGGTVAIGPGQKPRLFLFFATWDQEVTSLAGHLEALDGYEAAAAGSGLPSLTAIDEGSVEPSPGALAQFLHGLRRPLSYQVAVDESGQVADGYEVQGEPWFVLTSASGQILWYHEVDTSGWPSRRQLADQVRAALARVPGAPASAASAARKLAGSPAALASLHQQAGQLLGSEPALAARIRALRGYPIVINAWASWCTPCRSEFSLFADASARYGRRVAFIGADTDDSAGDARSFLAQHPVSYPSYQASASSLASIVPQGLEGLPTTIYIDRTGKVVDVHTGQYDAQGTLDQDIGSYALAG